MPASAEVERRALALLEELLDNPDDEAFAQTLLSGEPEAVRVRVSALQTAMTQASSLLPTELPDGATVHDEADIPAQVGAFRLVRRLGYGGMGGVWLGERADGLYDQKVAIKFIRAGLVDLAGEAFLAERRILARLEHPNIARLIDGGVTAEGTPYLIMEYVDGLPIDEAVQGQSLAARVKLFVKAADAVQFAHARLVVHADLKPSNIFVDGQGRVKLLDFGISRLLEVDDHAHGALPMTKAYASPARLVGVAPAIADDVYALGIILGDLVTADGDEDLKAIAAMARHEDEARRYGSVAALIADLDRWRDQLPVAAREPTLAYRAHQFVRRHFVGVLSTAAALVALSLLAAVAMFNAVRAENNRVRAEQRFDEVRQLSKFMLYDLYDELARQPGTVVKREEIARTSANYLARLNLSAETSPALRLDAARSYRRLAAIQGLSGTSSLGHPDDALKSLDRAEALVAQDKDAGPLRGDFLVERGWIHLDRWTLQPDNAASAKQNGVARGYFEQARALAPGSVDVALGLLVTTKNDAYDAIWSSDDAKGAVKVATQALAQVKARTWPGGLTDVAAKLRIELLSILGEAYYQTEDLGAALAAYRESAAVIDDLIAREGPMPYLIILKGQNAFDLSGTMGDMPSRGLEALGIARQGEAVLKTMLAQGPDAAAEKKLLVLYGQEALLLSDLGRKADALVPSAASVALRDKRLAASPADPQRMRDLAIGLGSHVDRLGEAGRGGEACLAGRRAVAIWDRITALKHLGALDARKNVPKSAERVKTYCGG
ncbi:MAG: serine/threonine protein kinase [Sphingobium sp.]|nr:serine/threonine protein kinase [Sphingobium sp.]